jgi:hypothetical protein
MRVGHSDDRDVGDRGVGGQHILDFEGGNILRVADDRIFDTTRDTDIAVCINQPEIACAQPSILVERVGVKCGVGITEEALGSLEPQLAFIPDGAVRFLGCRPRGR